MRGALSLLLVLVPEVRLQRRAQGDRERANATRVDADDEEAIHWTASYTGAVERIIK
jgi:hypothetical protein